MARLDDQVAALKERITARQQDKAKADHAHAVAQAKVESTTQELKDEFDIAPEEIPAFMKKLEADLAAEVKRVYELLEKAGG